MSLIKPLAQSKTAFDATQDSVFYFTSSGGDQVVKNKITIRLQSDNSVVYTNTVETYQSAQTVPANTLTNGVYYNYYFNTYNSDDAESDNSNTVSFYCYTQPTLKITNISDESTVSASSQEVIVKYSQKEGELLNEVTINLYDSSNNLVANSGNIYDASSITQQFSYTFSGFENDAIYKLISKGVTVNGTNIESDLITFNVKYNNPVLFSNLNVETKCNEGYNQILSNFIEINGTSNKDNLVYIRQLKTEDGIEYIEWDTSFLIDDTSNPRITNWTEATMVELLTTDDYVEWNDGFNITSNFIIEIWLRPSSIDKIIDLRNASGDGYTITFVRDIPYSETTVKDYFVLKGYENNVLQVYQESNYIDLFNNLTNLVVWVKKNGNGYELKLEAIYTQNNTFEWGSSDVEVGKVSDLYWKGESYSKGVETEFIANDMSSIFPLSDVKVCNAVFDNIDINTDMSKVYSSEKPDWTYKTVLNCAFDGSLKGGNTDLVLSQITGLRVKRREKGKFDWITLYDLDVESTEDLNIIKNDINIPANVTQQYALVPMLGDGNEGEYIIVENTPKWNGIFISNADTIFKLYNGVSYGAITNNLSIGTLSAIGSKYPYVIKNSIIDYDSGSISGQLYGYDFETSGQINRISVVNQINDIISILKNDIVVIKDWNGNIWLARMIDSPTINYDTNGMAYATISFNFVEQGQYDSQSDLYSNGLIDVEV